MGRSAVRLVRVTCGQSRRLAGRSAAPPQEAAIRGGCTRISRSRLQSDLSTQGPVPGSERPPRMALSNSRSVPDVATSSLHSFGRRDDRTAKKESVLHVGLELASGPGEGTASVH